MPFRTIFEATEQYTYFGFWMTPLLSFYPCYPYFTKHLDYQQMTAQQYFLKFSIFKL